MASGRDRPGRDAFPDTRWSLVAAAQHSEGSRDELVSLYHRPVRAFFLKLARNAPEADELTQGFFVKELAHLAEARGGVVHGDKPSAGRFRDYLARSLKNHWLGDLRRRGKFRGELAQRTMTRGNGLKFPSCPTPSRAF